MFLKMQKKINYDAWENIVYGFKNWILQLFTQDDMKTDSSDEQTDILDMTEQSLKIF